MIFTSDNAAPAHPAVIESVAAANDGTMPAYGADPIMEGVTDRVREIFEAPDAAVHLVSTGTAANALALACLCPPWATVFCHRNAHVEEDECGAPEFYTGGAKLALVDGEHARMGPQALERAIAFTGRAGVHNSQRGAVSITNSTENGAIYRPTDVAALTEVGRAAGLPVHLDGARFANALVAANASPAEMTWRAGIDAVSFGATKNGAMNVEAVILFDPARSWEFQLRRKRGGHLFSKHRYLSAQMAAYLKDDLWLDLARRANRAAAKLSSGLAAIAGARLIHPTEANAVFAEWPRAAHRRVREAGADYYLWPFNQSLEGPGDVPLAARLVCSWSTTEDEIDRFLQIVAGRETSSRSARM